MKRDGAGFERGEAFLREQLSAVEHKIARFIGALKGCQNNMESESLERMSHAAKIERDLLLTLIEQQAGDTALSLDALLMQRLNTSKRQAAELSQGWQRGRPSPSGYWEAESRCGILANLLRRYHAWRSGRAFYPAANDTDASKTAPPLASPRLLLDPTHGGQVHMHPWYIPAPAESALRREESPADNGAGELAFLDSLKDDLIEALHKIGFPEEHVELILQPGGFVIVKGYAHAEEQAKEAIETILQNDFVSELLSDIKVTDPARCPVCYPPVTKDAPPEQSHDTD